MRSAIWQSSHSVIGVVQSRRFTYRQAVLRQNLAQVLAKVVVSTLQNVIDCVILHKLWEYVVTSWTEESTRLVWIKHLWGPHFTTLEYNVCNEAQS